MENHTVKIFAADQGIITQSQYHVFVPEVQEYLRKEKIEMECGEAYRHDNGFSHSERAIRTIKELIRFAVIYLLSNPNFSHLGFAKKQIFQLWSELFNWSIWVMRLKRSTKDKTKSKFEVYHGSKPDFWRIRLLPIFAIVQVERQNARNNPMMSNRAYWQRGIHVGPSSAVPGSIRVTVLTPKKKLQVLVTANFKAVSDGGDVPTHRIVDNFMRREYGDVDSLGELL